MSKTKSKKLSELRKELGEIDKLYIDLEHHNFVLVRENDNKQMPGTVIKFIEWNENGTFKSVHDEMAIGRSVVIDPSQYGQFRWMTTTITEILSESKFKTLNSTYNIYKL